MFRTHALISGHVPEHRLVSAPDLLVRDPLYAASQITPGDNCLKGKTWPKYNRIIFAQDNVDESLSDDSNVVDENRCKLFVFNQTVICLPAKCSFVIEFEIIRVNIVTSCTYSTKKLYILLISKSFKYFQNSALARK